MGLNDNIISMEATSMDYDRISANSACMRLYRPLTLTTSIYVYGLCIYIYIYP